MSASARVGDDHEEDHARPHRQSRGNRLPHRAQNVLLLVSSYVFYGWWDWRFLGLLVFPGLAAPAQSPIFFMARAMFV